MSFAQGQLETVAAGLPYLILDEKLVTGAGRRTPAVKGRRFRCNIQALFDPSGIPL